MNTTVIPMWCMAINIVIFASIVNHVMLTREMRKKGWIFNPVSHNVVGRWYMISARHATTHRLIFFNFSMGEYIFFTKGEEVGRVKTDTIAKAAKAFDRHWRS